MDDQLIQFAFPANVKYPCTNARVLVFANYGPTDEDGKMRGGHKKSHVLTESELSLMIEEEERQELLAVFWEGQSKMPRSEEDRILNALRFKVPQITKPLLERLLQQELGDDKSFLAVQKLLLSEQAKRLKRLRALFPSPDKRFIDRVEVKAHQLYLNPPKRTDRDQFGHSSAMLSKNGSTMVQMEEVNNPVSKLNASLLRHDCNLGAKHKWTARDPTSASLDAPLAGSTKRIGFQLKTAGGKANDSQFEEDTGRIGNVADLGSRLTRLCEQAFKKFDKDGSGVINRADIEATLAKTDSDEKYVISSFLESFSGAASGKITKAAFLNYCLDNRNLCPNDQYFLTAFQNGWRLKEDSFVPPPSNVYLAGNGKKAKAVSDRVLYDGAGRFRKAYWVLGGKLHRPSSLPDLAMYSDQPWYS